MLLNTPKTAKSEQNSSVIEEADDHEIFDINDFTTASDWERFAYLYYS